MTVSGIPETNCKTASGTCSPGVLARVALLAAVLDTFGASQLKRSKLTVCPSALDMTGVEAAAQELAGHVGAARNYLVRRALERPEFLFRLPEAQVKQLGAHVCQHPGRVMHFRMQRKTLVGRAGGI